MTPTALWDCEPHFSLIEAAEPDERAARIPRRPKRAHLCRMVAS